MKNGDRTKEQLMSELMELRRRNAELEASEIERKRVEVGLRESKSRFKGIADAIGDILWEVDRNAAFTFCSKSVEGIWGVPVSEALGKTPLDFMDQEEAERVLEYLEEVFREKRNIEDFENWYTHSDGHSVCLLTNGVPILDERGEVKGYRGVCRDITERKRVERGLLESKERYALATRAAKVGVWDWGVKTGEFYLDPNVKAILGYNDDEIPNDLDIWATYVHPNDRQPVMEAFEAHIQGLTPEYVYEHRMMHKDGSIRWIMVRGTAIRDAQGEVIRVVGTDTDITERKLAEENLGKRLRYEEGLALCSHALLKGGEAALMEALRHLLNTTKASRACIFENFEDPDDGLCARQTYEVCAPGVDPKIENPESQRFPYKDGFERWREVLSRGKHIDGAMEAFPPEERRILESCSILSILVLPINVREKWYGFIGFDDIWQKREWDQQDIRTLQTAAEIIGFHIEREHARQELAFERAQLLSIFDGISEVVYVADPNTHRVLYVNRFFRELMGKDPVGCLCYEEFQNLQSPCEFCTNEIIMREKGKTYEWEYHNPVLDRDYMIFDRLITWPDGRDARFEMAVDITDRKRMEEELLKSQKLESIGVLAGGIAHDFNNILTGILGNISLARIYRDMDKIGERLVEAEKASFRARDLTQRLLTFSRGGAPIKTISSITEVLKGSTAFALSGSNVRCQMSIPDDLWPVEIDEGQMHQVLSNLIINSDQAMPAGGVIELSAENMAISPQDTVSLRDGDHVKISLKDQGIGIPEEYLKKIFDPYFTTKQKGSGLGLAICYSIVKNHDGDIAVESRVGAGTTFHIYLPAFPENASLDKEKKEERPVMGEGRILVMDDEELVRELASNMLTDVGYEVTIAQNGAEAVQLYQEAKRSDRQFDAAILDLTVSGGMGGKETIRKLMEIDPQVKAVVSSGYSNDPIMADFKNYGFKSVIAKPYRIRELSEVLHGVINDG